MKVVAQILALSAIAFCLTACVSETLSVGSGELVANRNISYGPLKRQKYNVYRPAKGSETAPVVVYIYGGAWSRGDRRQYSFVAKALAKQGFVAVIPDYRVFPQAQFPTFVEDAALAVSVIRKRVSPNRPVFLMGHSAGAHIAALLTVDKSYLSKIGLDVCRDIAGFAGLAGPYDFNPPSRGKFSNIFPPALRAKSKPVNFKSRSFPPILLLHGDVDRTVRPGHSRRFDARLKVGGADVDLKLYPNVGHVGILGAYSTIVPTKARTVTDVANFVRRYQEVRGNTCR